ncbi:MAG: NAD(P)H-binding protein, partial [Thiothrix sp.]|nr:NAD(P)H-binding protein [Thiothrix sp.]
MKSTHVLILGASGAIARHVIAMLQGKDNIKLTLFVRDASTLGNLQPATKVITGDVLNPAQLNAAMQGQDIVYANLAGAVDKMATRIVASMQENQR